MAFGILSAWLVAVGAAFWWFQFRNIDSYDVYWASFEGKSLLNRPLATDSKARVVHFVDPDCPCSRFSYEHIASLEQRFSNFAAFSWAPFPESPPHSAPTSRIAVPAGPAVAIWDKRGELAYFGPYSGGAVCGQGVDFVSSTLEALRENDNPQWINNEAVGCFCRWKNS